MVENDELRANETKVRVRYPEVDPQGVVHHGVYVDYIELGRTELLRAAGAPYRKLEDEGTRLVVTECRLRYLRPARYDDVIIVRTHVDRVTRVRIFLSYEVIVEASGELACQASTTLAAVDERGSPCPLSERLASALAQAREGRRGEEGVSGAEA